MDQGVVEDAVSVDLFAPDLSAERVAPVLDHLIALLGRGEELNAWMAIMNERAVLEPLLGAGIESLDQALLEGDLLSAEAQLRAIRVHRFH
jgi:hypothetical protein